MITNLQYLGIYEDSINMAIDIAEQAVDAYVTSSSHPVDDLADLATDWLQECGSFENITNSIIAAWFSSASSMIERDNPKLVVDYFINCDDSHFYINGEEIYGGD